MRTRDLGDLVSRMACIVTSRMACIVNVPSEARAIMEGGVSNGAKGLPRA